jgi:hypothetical protein
MDKFEITLQQGPKGWSITIEFTDNGRQGPVSLLHPEPTLHEAVQVMLGELASMARNIP